LSEDNFNLQLSTSEIETALELASKGDRTAAETFFRSFLRYSWLVVSRYQSFTLNSLATYPSDIMDYLAIKHGDRVVVPLFTSNKKLINWSSRSFSYRTVLGGIVLNSLPNDWWIEINPGDEGVTKELSPWEINLIKKQRFESLNEIIDELYANESESSEVVINEANNFEYGDLFLNLINEAKDISQLSALYLLEQQLEEGNKKLLLGILLQEGYDLTLTKAEIKHLNTHFTNLTRRYLIGDYLLTSFIGDEKDPNLALFVNFEPFYINNGDNS
jgi:hypothetical protein